MSDKSHIIAVASQQFTKYGIASVSMDTVAERAGISKTTLYSFFESKEALVETVLKTLIQLWKQQINEIVEASDNPVQKVYKMYSNAIKELKKLDIVFIHDLRKYYGTYFKSYEAIKHYFVFDVVQSLLNEAKAKDMLLPNVCAQHLCEMYFLQFDVLLRPIYSKENYSHRDILYALIYPVLNGILRPEYRDAIDVVDV